MRKFILPLATFVFASSALSQPPPPAATGSGSGQVKKFAGWPSVSSLPVTEQFASLEGRFKIGLPKSISGFAALSPKQTGSSATGQQYTWKFAEGDVVFFFLDFPDSNLTGSAADLVRIAENSKKRITERVPDAKLVSENQSTVNGVPASYFMYDLGLKGFATVQLFIDKKRVYRIDAAFKDRKTEKHLTSVFASFSLISQAEVDAELARRYEAMKPVPLPQAPAVSRPTSDAQDEGLKGKVKKVIEESEDRSGTWGVQGRKTTSVEYYDQSGALTQRDSYDSQGKPFQITVYGYIDGMRVSNYKTDNEGNVFTVMGAPSPAVAIAPRKSDPRFKYSYEYKYEGGKLVERQMVHNNGRRGMRYAYKHSLNQVEELVYSDDGKLNQRYVSILDANGNEIERTDFGVVNHDLYGDRRYKYSYEFDAAGNWVKKVTLKEVKENGVTSWLPDYISYRTITYY
ncbi:MAG: hypothetical protein JNJ39_09815 [Blastocatellia bacterium]|nr:hypothetical protein [Blastocatellia bacterium]